MKFLLTQCQRMIEKTPRPLWVISALVLIPLILIACQPIQPMAEEAAAPAAEVASAGDAANGAYVAALVGCGCHNNGDLGGLAGGREFTGTFGSVYAANITSDAETGIGNYSDEGLVGLLRVGHAEVEGEAKVLMPIMPYKLLSNLSDADAQDMVAWLRSLPPIVNEVPERELAEEPAAWDPTSAAAAESPTEPADRGKYIITLANCGGCHNPKNEDGSPKADMLLAGSPIRGEFAANLTPDEETGLGKWTEEQIAAYLRTGTKPDGSQVEGAMAQQIERRFKNLSEGDAAAIAAYLKSIPAVVNAAP